MGKGQVERPGRFNNRSKPIKKNISKKEYDKQSRIKKASKQENPSKSKALKEKDQ